MKIYIFFGLVLLLPNSLQCSDSNDIADFFGDEASESLEDTERYGAFRFVDAVSQFISVRGEEDLEEKNIELKNAYFAYSNIVGLVDIDTMILDKSAFAPFPLSSFSAFYRWIDSTRNHITFGEFLDTAAYSTDKIYEFKHSAIRAKMVLAQFHTTRSNQSGPDQFEALRDLILRAITASPNLREGNVGEAAQKAYKELEQYFLAGHSAWTHAYNLSEIPWSKEGILSIEAYLERESKNDQRVERVNNLLKSTYDRNSTKPLRRGDVNGSSDSQVSSNSGSVPEAISSFSQVGRVTSETGVSNSFEEENVLSCPICLDPYTSNKIAIAFDCDDKVIHHFCLECINTLPPNAPCCPLCRKDIVVYDPRIGEGYTRIIHRDEPLDTDQAKALKNCLDSYRCSNKPFPHLHQELKEPATAPVSGGLQEISRESEALNQSAHKDQETATDSASAKKKGWGSLVTPRNMLLAGAVCCGAILIYMNYGSRGQQKDEMNSAVAA